MSENGETENITDERTLAHGTQPNRKINGRVKNILNRPDRWMVDDGEKQK